MTLEDKKNNYQVVLRCSTDNKQTVARACEACINADLLRHADGGLYNALPLPAICFGMILNVADPSREQANGVVVGTERV